MRFIVSSREFLSSLQLIGGVITTNPTLTILENFLLEIKNRTIKITASDGETTLQTTINVTAEKEGRIVINAKLLLEVLKTFDDELLEFKIRQNILEIIDKNDNYFINLENPDLYPSHPELKETTYFKFYGNLLSKVISKTLFAAGNDSIRPIMTGVLFEINQNGCNIVATDAHRLVKYTIKNCTSDDPFEFIMPKKPLILLKNALINASELVKIEFNSTNVCFTYLHTTWICRLIEGKYPNYNAVIPEENLNTLQIKTSTLANAIKRISYFANKSNLQVQFKFEGNILKISAEDTNFNNKAYMHLSCNYSGENLTIGYNSKFLLEMVSNVDTENLVLKMSTSNRPGVIKPISDNDNEDMLMLVMPVMMV